MKKAKLIVPLDFDTRKEAEELLAKLGDTIDFYKVGKQLFTREGPEIVRWLKRNGKQVFLDLKFHDIPNTVAKAVAAARDLGVELVNVHASGGAEMMEAASRQVSNSPTKLIAVTVLTSLDQQGLEKIGFRYSPEDLVVHLATLARDAGLAGVVASARETRIIKQKLGTSFLVVTPGIRPSWSSSGDQKRIETPAAAIQDGSDYLVVGRPIIEHSNPAEAAGKVLAEMGD